MLDILYRLIICYTKGVFSGYDILHQIRITSNILSDLLLIMLSSDFFTLLDSPSLVMNISMGDFVDLRIS